MGLYDDIGNAQMGAGNIYFIEGNYPAVRILKVFDKFSRKKQPLFIIETEIIQSDVPALTAGKKVSQTINLTHDSGLGDVKQFIYACLGFVTKGVDPKTLPPVTPQVVEQVTSSANPFGVSPTNPNGTILSLNCFVKHNEEKQTKFTTHTWYPYGQMPGVTYPHQAQQAATRPVAPAAPAAPMAPVAPTMPQLSQPGLVQGLPPAPPGYAWNAQGTGLIPLR